MSRALVFIGGWPAFEFQQRRIEPIALADETLVVFLERLQTRRRPFQFGLRRGACTNLRDIAPGAFEFDFGAAAGTFIFQLHLVVPDHSFDQFVARQHSFPRPLEFGGFLVGDLRAVLAGIHGHYFRSTCRPPMHIDRQHC